MNSIRPSIALYQPDMPQNCGAIMRLCACFGVPLHLIEPFGFVWDDAKVKRVAMDYINFVNMTRHKDWDAFLNASKGQRLVLLTTKSSAPYTEFKFEPSDILLLGRESAGVPDDVHAIADARVVIPLQKGLRSLNVGMSAAIVLSEALRQTRNM
ncbi:MAG: tRNA (cytidine(34)-2'-O)-methyltransferase [Alphaproteobacteria bacterium]|nr:tRNA (cytidine(34)-2'-O)-methyltransferase [Alphaproteobacteria bacterium]